MQTVVRSNFTTVKTEGAILPADLLQRVADGRVDGLRPEDYHLSPGERLNEAINRSWNRLLGVWQTFSDQRERLSETDSGTTLTRERWLLILFQELGYGRLTYEGSLEIPNPTSETENPKYPISHVWGQTPIHLITFRQALDRRDPTVKRSPHSLMQELLNRSDDYLWGMVSNGLTLRILRDNASLTRAAYVEFDVEMMMTGEVYADFSLLWLLCHQSRIELLQSEEGETAVPSNCWLERWSQEAAEQGTRALDALRDGVQEAIAALGRGFLSHPANGALRGALRSGSLGTQEYYRQLLRMVYRMIFLFVAEDRELLLVESETAQHRQRYYDYYSLGRLRGLAERRRGGPHPDLYRGLRLLFFHLREGYAPLGLPALGSFLFSERATPWLDEADIANRELLESVRALAFTQEGRVRRTVDYKNLGSEELGSVYESLLELHPQLNVEAGAFELATAAGSERKTTGSYYTPTSLITELLNSALEPVVVDRLREANEWFEKWKRGELGNRELGIGTPTPYSPPPTPSKKENDNNDPVVSGFEGLAGGDGFSGGLLSTDKAVSERGNVRNDESDSESGRISSGQHRGGKRPGDDTGVHSLSTDRSGVFERVGNPSATGGASGTDNGGSDKATTGAMHGRGKDVAGVDKGVGEEKGIGNREWGIGERTATPNSLLPTPSNKEKGKGNREWDIGEALPTPYSLLPTPHSYQQFQEAALLNLKVIDPACGSGHFLIAAANRLALHLARVRTGDSEPSPSDRRAALRDVVHRCIYGVDINEMSVELCKVALWMETLDPGKPLGFLEKNILCGNSLMGATPALLAGGIPDEAFKPITGDDKAYCAEWKKQNKKQRESGQLFRLDDAPWNRLGNLAASMLSLDGVSNETLADVRRQQELYEQMVNSADYRYGRLWADAWCAAFVWVKRGEVGSGEVGSRKGFAYPITEEVFRRIERNPFDVADWMVKEIAQLREEYQFFHWHVAFPQVFVPRGRGGIGNGEWGVGEDGSIPDSLLSTPSSPTGWTGGFDVVLGNPPWERIKLQEKEWFAARDPAIAGARNAAARRKLIKQLPQTNKALFDDFMGDKRKAEGESQFVRDSEKYPLCGRGDVNTYTIFAELSRHVLSGKGRAGIIVPSGIAIDDTTKYFFQDLLESKSLVSLYDFWEIRRFFPGTDSRNSFCLLTLCGEMLFHRKGSDFVFGIHEFFEIQNQQRHFHLSDNDVRLLNPNTRTCPTFHTQRDAELTKEIYRRVPVLILDEESGAETNPWAVKLSTMFHMSGDSALFQTQAQLKDEGWELQGNQFVRGDKTFLPLYEAKMFRHFDHRWSTYDGPNTRDVTLEELNKPTFYTQPRYWIARPEVSKKLEDVHGWLMGFRNIARSTDERSGIFSLLPLAGVGHSAPLIYSEIQVASFLIVANFNSFVTDYVTRQKLGGINFTFGYVKQTPILPPSVYQKTTTLLTNKNIPLSSWFLPRILELTYTAYDLRPFAQDCGYHGPPFRWDEERRFLLRCELDAAYFHLYGIGREDVDYIMETFPIVKRKDEKAHGEYRTKRVILEIYDEMAVAMGNGELGIGNRATPHSLSPTPAPYQTRLDPPPAHPEAAHPWDEAYLGERLPVDAWWQEVADEEVKSEKGEVEAPPLTLRAQVVAERDEERGKKDERQAAQLSLGAVVFAENSQPLPLRLKRAMQLGQPKSENELVELVSFLADENSNIRWLASAALARHGGVSAVRLLGAFWRQAEAERQKIAWPEIEKVLGMVGDMGDAAVKALVAEVLEGMGVDGE